MKVNIKRIRATLDPPIDVFHIEIDYENGSVWEESLHTESDITIFMRGVQAGSHDLVPLLYIPPRPDAHIGFPAMAG